MKIELDELVFIFKGDMPNSKYNPPAQPVTPYKVNFNSRRIGCYLKTPNHNYGSYRANLGFEHFIVSDKNDAAAVLFANNKEEK